VTVSASCPTTAAPASASSDSTICPPQQRVSVFRRSTRKAAQAAAVLATQMECSELEAAGRVQYEALQQETVTLWQRLIASHPDVVLAVLGHAFESSSANAAPLGVWDTEAHLVLLAPDLAALPERYPTTTAAGNLSLRKFTKGEMADLYKQLVAGLCSQRQRRPSR